jgi:hypothetical protein
MKKRWKFVLSFVGAVLAGVSSVAAQNIAAPSNPDLTDVGKGVLNKFYGKYSDKYRCWISEAIRS